MTTAIYARVSTDSDDQSHALEQQLHRLRTKAQELGQPVVEFIDVASGVKDDRRELKRLLEACTDGLIDTVLCTRLDRMSRSTVHGGKLLRLFNQPSWPNLICLDQPLDLSTATGRFYASLLMGMAQMESEIIGERVHHGQMYARTQLKPQAGKPPFGYCYTEGKANYALDPNSQERARQIVAEFLRTASLRDAFDFQQAHCGGPFISLEGLRRWLLNPALAGYRVYGTNRWDVTEDGQRKRRLNPPGKVDELHANAHVPLISEAERQEVLAIMRSLSVRKYTHLRHRRSRVLTGLVICAHCGGPMYYHQPRLPGPNYLRCTQQRCTVRPHKVIKEEKVIKAALERLYEQRELLALGSVVDELRLRQRLTPEIAQLQSQIQELTKLADPDVAEVITRKQERLHGLMQSCMEAGGSRFSVQDAAQALELPEVWEDLTSSPERLRRLLTQWVERIVVREGEVEEVVLRVADAAATAP